MKIIAVFLVCFSSIFTIAQPMQVEWVKTIPGSLYEENKSMSQAPCGDLYVGGFFQEYFAGLTSIGGEEGFIAKYNDEGQLQWLKQLGGADVDRVNGVVVADDHQIYVVGEFKGVFYYNNDSLVSQSELDVFIVKIDSSGNIQWAKSGGGLGYESANAISLFSNGNIGITGYYESTITFDTTTIQGYGLRDVFIATFDALGNLQWLESFGGPAFETARSIQTDATDNVYITGSFRDFLFLGNDTITGNGNYDAYLAKYNANGVFQWVKTMGGPSTDEGTYVNIDNDQNVYAVGWYDRSMDIDSTTLNGAREEDGYVTKFDPNGNLLWANPIAGNFDDRCYAVDFDADNNVYVMGTLDFFLVLGGDTLFNKHLNRPTNIFISKYDENGNYKWAQSLGASLYDFCFDLLVKDASTLYIAGSFQDTTIYVTDTLISQYDFDVFLAKFMVDTTVGIQKLPNQGQQVVLDMAIYPNPCLYKSVLTYYLVESAQVKVTLYDLLGRERRAIFSNNQAVGNHQVPIHRGVEESGLYFLHLETKESSSILEISLE